MWKAKDLNKNILDLALPHRYQPAVDENELKELNSDYIEQYAFATLCEQILGKSTEGQERANGTPHVQEFREYW